MVEVFKTNVQEAEQAEQITSALLQHFSFHRITFDLDDCDRILRIKGEYIDADKIISLTNEIGFTCEVLED